MKNNVVFQLEKCVCGALTWGYRYQAKSIYAGSVIGKLTPDHLHYISRVTKAQPVVRYYPDTWACDCAI